MLRIDLEGSSSEMIMDLMELNLDVGFNFDQLGIDEDDGIAQLAALAGLVRQDVHLPADYHHYHDSIPQGNFQCISIDFNWNCYLTMLNLLTNCM